MEIDDIQKICRSFKGVTEDIKWEDHLCFNVGGKMFLITAPDRIPHSATFKVREEDFDELTEREGFSQAAYMAKRMWVSVDDINRVGKTEWKEFLKTSYDLVVAKLPLKMRKELLAGLLIMALLNSACGQSSSKMDFESYNPVSTLVVPEHKLTRSKYPFIDVHNHQWGMSRGKLTELVTDMDKLNMAVMVNLSGVGGSTLKEYEDNIRQNFPNRFLVFTNIDFDGIGQDGWTDRAVKRLEQDVKNGASGLKIYKSLGLSEKDNTGKLVKVDDPRLDAIWKKCGELKIPVLIHSADPKSFWDPMDDKNERWLELETHPGRRRTSNDPSFDELLTQQHNMFRKHPETTFIAAHFGWLGGNLDSLSRLMDQLPNIVVEFGAVIAELGRQPRAAAAFFQKYQDRILFGKDSWAPAEYATYFRVLETADEYFPYHKKYHAFWRMYGMNLPDDILKKIYYKNALRIIPGIDKSLFKD